VLFAKLATRNFPVPCLHVPSRAGYANRMTDSDVGIGLTGTANANSWPRNIAGPIYFDVNGMQASDLRLAVQASTLIHPISFSRTKSYGVLVLPGLPRISRLKRSLLESCVIEQPPCVPDHAVKSDSEKTQGH